MDAATVALLAAAVAVDDEVVEAWESDDRDVPFVDARDPDDLDAEESLVFAAWALDDRWVCVCLGADASRWRRGCRFSAEAASSSSAWTARFGTLARSSVEAFSDVPVAG